MREIKFRAFDNTIPGDKKIFNVKKIDFVERIVISKTSEDVVEEIKKEGSHYCSNCDPYYDVEHSFDNIELMQYTGYKDRNGDKIYEGDVLIWHKPEEHMIVIWEDRFARFVLKRACSSEIICMDSYICDHEIVGNIYENPEVLLEDPT